MIVRRAGVSPVEGVLPSFASIIVTNYNYGRFLARAIESAFAQTYPKLEVIVVDDASQDNSRDVIASFGDRIVPVLQPQNMGQGAAFNAGFQASRGDIVFFLDADDYLYPSALEAAVAEIERGAALVQFRLDLVDGDGRWIDTIPAQEVSFDRGNVVAKLIERGRFECMVTSGNAFRRDVLQALMPVPEAAFRISADGYLVTLAPLYGNIAALDTPLGAYTLHGGNQWAGAAATPEAQAARLRRSILHDFDRYDALRRRARMHNIEIAQQPGMADPLHLAARLGSIVLQPEAHPCQGDSRAMLGMRGARATLAANVRLANRAVLAVWFLAAGLLPRAWAEKVVVWRLFPASRPAGLQCMLARVKGFMRSLQFRREA